MKRIVLAAAAIVALAGTSAANTVDTSAGTKSLIFSFSGLSNLGVYGYNPGTTPVIAGSNLSIAGVGLRMGMGDGTALRAGVTLGLASETDEAVTSGQTDDKTSVFTFGVNGALEKYLTPSNSRVATYVGVGAGFGVASHTSEPPRSTNPGAGTPLKVTTSGFNFGAAGLAGFRAGIFKGVDLGGEYALGLNLGSSGRETETQGNPKVKNDSSSFNLGTSVASLYLSVAWG